MKTRKFRLLTKSIFFIFLLVCMGYSCDKETPPLKEEFQSLKSVEEVSFDIWGIETGLPDDYIRCITVDNDDNIWIGTYDSGIAKFNGETWQLYSTANSDLPNDSIWAIKADLDNNIWVGTVNGLARFDNQNWTVFKDENLPGGSNLISAIDVDANNTKWIGYGHNDEGGILEFDNTNWTLYTPDNSELPGRIINDIHVDKQNRIWFGTWYGAACFTDNEWTIYNKENSMFSYNTLWGITDDLFGNTWFGFNGTPYSPAYGTLLRFDGNHWFEHKPSESGISSDEVYDLVSDGYGNIWVSTFYDQNYHSQIMVFSGKSWVSLHELNPELPEDMQVFQMEFDSDGNLWCVVVGFGLVKIEIIYS